MTQWIALWHNRRLLVLGHFASLFLLVWLGASKRGSLVIAILLFLLYIVTVIRLNSVGKPYAINQWKAAGKLDERQSRVRDHALAHSYFLTYASVVALTVWVLMADSLGMWQPRTTTEWLFTLWVVTTSTSMLPAALIAWNEPPELEPEGLRR